MAELSVITYSGEDGYIVAECLEIPGCLSQGRTKEEALKNIQDAIRECLSRIPIGIAKSPRGHQHESTRPAC